MFKEWKDKWLEALRSGDYKQGRTELRTKKDEYCCLGVLCDIVEPETWLRKGHGPWEFEGNGGSLPQSIMKKVGLKEGNPMVEYMHEGRLERCSLATTNDSCGLDFKRIADIIEHGIVATTKPEEVKAVSLLPVAVAA